VGSRRRRRSAAAEPRGQAARQACGASGLSLEQWIIDQRLEAAHADLASSTGRRRSIAATSRAYGFQDPSHFSRRFRGAYGMTPRDWQQLAAGHTA
jgi:AraC-like DNA-binding protein